MLLNVASLGQADLYETNTKSENALRGVGVATV